ncbi:tyrosine-type recombinase/integrase, partial [Sulfitobacter dubius]|uniref:tyrosine-type recombinase/integrase n=1 Tax=Sulfitobacter dubius TaxID=218673 RepID=UPI003AFB539F
LNLKMKNPQTIENTWHPISKTLAERQTWPQRTRSWAQHALVHPKMLRVTQEIEIKVIASPLPSHVAGSGTLDQLVETARGYAKQAASENTLKAYAKDWAHFARWCRLKGTDPLPPSPEMIGLYLANLAAPTGKAPALSVSTIERRLSGLSWNYKQRDFNLDRKNRHIATVLAGIKRKHARPPVQKEAILAEDILAMVGTLPFDLRGMRDRAILLLGYAGGLRRSEIICLDVHKDDTPDSGGWIEIFDKGALLTLNAKTGWREVEIGRGSSDQTCPVHALKQWLHFAKIDFGPGLRGSNYCKLGNRTPRMG